MSFLLLQLLMGAIFVVGSENFYSNNLDVLFPRRKTEGVQRNKAPSQFIAAAETTNRENFSNGITSLPKSSGAPDQIKMPTVEWRRKKRGAERGGGNSVYQESYETWETVQRTPATPTEAVAVETQIRRPVSADRPSSRQVYVEYAETEFMRPGFYFPVPFLVGPHSVGQIPTQALSQLARQHIARNRQRQQQLSNVNTDGSPILQGVSRLTELRQTPFRRMPTNSSRMFYAEKRRQWKEEWKRRYRERFGTSTAPPSTLTPLAAVEGDAGMTLSSANAATPIESASTLHRYFVTYNPNTKTYHVSRRPPSSSVLTDDGQSGIHTFVTLPPSSTMSTATVNLQTVRGDGAGGGRQYSTVDDEEIVPTITVIRSTTSTTAEPSTQPPPELFIHQRTDIIQMEPEATEMRVQAAPKQPLQLPTVVTILHMDDYDQDMEDVSSVEYEEGGTKKADKSNHEDTTVSIEPIASPDGEEHSMFMPTTPQPTSATTKTTQTTTTQAPRMHLYQYQATTPPLFPTRATHTTQAIPIVTPSRSRGLFDDEESEEFTAEGDDDDETYFFKPSHLEGIKNRAEGERADSQQAYPANGRSGPSQPTFDDPVQITVHKAN